MTFAASSASVQPARLSRGRRLDTLDFWRGVVLCTIFINHVPGNTFERLTFRNFGLSDSAEAFVFISGVSLALAYGSRFFDGRRFAAIRSLGRRAVKLYVTHVGLSLAGLAVFALGAAIFVDAGLMDVHGRDLAVDDPGAALIGLLSLGHQFGYFNILPLYVVLVAAVPVQLWLARFGLAAMLVPSFVLYVGARVAGLNVPTWPMQGSWFLDPFTWQFLMAIGLAVGLSLRGGSFKATNPVLLAVAVAGLVVGLVIATDGLGQVSGLYDAARERLDLGKTDLGLGRLAHFLCLAYVVAALRLGERLRDSRCFAPLSLLGRHGLAVFAALSLLAALGQVLTQGLGHTLALDAMVVGGGLAALYGFALLLDEPQRQSSPLFAAAHRRR